MGNPEFKSKYNKLQRFIALIGIALLVLLYLVTIVCAIIASPATKGLFTASLFASLFIPLAIWGIVRLAKLFDRS